MEKELEDLLAIKKKSEASVAKKERFFELTLKSLKEHGLSSENFTVLEKGFALDGARAFAEYLKTSEKNKIKQINLIINYSSFKDNKKGMTFKFLLSLTAQCLNSGLEKDFIGHLYALLPNYSKNKEGQILNDIEKNIEKYFFAQLGDDVKLLTPGVFEYPKEKYSKIAELFFEFAKNPYSDEKLDIKRTEFLSDLKPPETPVLGEERIKKTIIAPKKEKKKNNVLKAELEKLRAQFESVKEENIELKRQILENGHKISELSAKIEEYALETAKKEKVINIFESNAQSAQREKLNAIAAKLKPEYVDFQTVKNTPMTEDLGENFRAQLNAVFKILQKNDIILEQYEEIDKEEL